MGMKAGLEIILTRLWLSLLVSSVKHDRKNINNKKKDKFYIFSLVIVKEKETEESKEHPES